MTTTVGFVGLGNIGKPMALRLAQQQEAADLEVWVYDVAPDPLADAERAGARIAPGVADLAAGCDVLCVMVRDDEQVRAARRAAGRSEPAPVVPASHVGIDDPLLKQ